MTALFARTFGRVLSLGVGTLALVVGNAYGDSISPASYAASLGVGDSVTVHKTVTIDTAPSTAVIDIMFVFDTTGSMGSAISGAQSTATSLLTTLSGLGNVESGAGYYNDPGAGITSDLTSSVSTTQTSINSYFASGGGDYPELGFDGISAAANGASWRPGSNRFIVALGDAGFKDGAANLASTAAALSANSINLIGVDFCASSGTCSVSPTFASEISALGGTNYASGTSGSDIANAISSAISSTFGSYKAVTVSDLGGGSPLFSVSTICTSADIGTCSGDTATGAFDRSTTRSFGFDVTFTRLASGDASFDTYALVDGGIVATEADRFGAGSGPATVPEPGTLALLLGGLFGLSRTRRRS